jgi:hypothetical protein
MFFHNPNAMTHHFNVHTQIGGFGVGQGGPANGYGPAAGGVPQFGGQQQQQLGPQLQGGGSDGGQFASPYPSYGYGGVTATTGKKYS